MCQSLSSFHSVLVVLCILFCTIHPQTHLALCVWNECPFILQVDLLIIKSLIFEKKSDLCSHKILLGIEEVYSKRVRLELINLHLKNCFI